MADKKITELPISTALDGTEIVPIVQGGITSQATTQDIADLGGGTQNLQSVTDAGNTTTNDIQFDAGVGILLDNTSRLREGTIDAGYGGAKGIAQICAVGYELKWESGTLYVMDGNGTHIRHSLYNFASVPGASEDISKGFLVGTRWSLDNGDVYVCTDNTITAAVWVLEASDFTSAEKTKLSGIASGAEVNVNADWNAVSGDAEILNKPTIPTKTSDLINDGDDGVSHFISLNDLPSNLILYATNKASDIPTYVKLVSSITDIDYNTTAVDVSTGAITTTNQFISALATSANIIVGNPGVFNITTIGNIRRTSGTGNAEFYFEVYKRRISGAETLIATSGSTPPVFNGVYAEFSATALWNDGIFIATDRIVLKFYGSRIVGGSNPTYDFQFGGSTPVRSLVPIPLTVLPVLTLDNLQDVTIASVANNEILTYESSTSLWKNKTVTTALGYTPANQDGTILYHSLKWFTPSGTVSTSGTTVTSIGSQFTSAMVGSKLTINGESRIITVYNATTIVTVASAYSTNYSGVIAGSWGVYSKVIEIKNDQYQYFTLYDSFGVLNQQTSGTQFYIKNFRTLNNNLNILDTGFVLGGSRNISWTNDTGSVNSVGGTIDTGLRRNAAGILEIYDGLNATGLLANRRDLLVRDINASKITFLAGTTTVAPLTLTAGVAPTTPNNGDIWYNGTDLKIKSNGLTKDLTTATTLDNLVFSGSYMPAKLGYVAPSHTAGINGVLISKKMSGRKTCTITSLSVWCLTGVAGGNVRLAVYSDLNGLPNTLLADTGNIACISSGLKEGTITPLTLVSGTTYHICLQVSSGTISLKYNISEETNYYDPTNFVYVFTVSATFAFAAFPTTFPAASYTSGAGYNEVIYLKAQ